MKSIYTLFLVFITSLSFSQGDWIDVGTAGFFGNTTSHDMTILDNGTPIVAYQDIASPGVLNIYSWNGTNWDALPAISSSLLSGATDLTDIKLVHIQNTAYVGFGDNGFGYEIHKFESGSWTPLDVGSTFNISYLIGSIDLAASSTLDDILFTYTYQDVGGDYPEIYQLNSGFWYTGFGNNLKAIFQNNDFSYYESDLFYNGTNAFYYTKYDFTGESPENVAKLYKSTGTGAAWATVDYSGNDYIVSDPSDHINVTGDPNGGLPYESHVKNEPGLGDTIYSHQLDVVDNYTALPTYGASNLTAFDIAEGNGALNYQYRGYSDEIENKLMYWDGASWNQVGSTDFYSTSLSLNEIDIEVQNPTNKKYILYYDGNMSQAGVRMYNNPPTLTSGANDVKLCTNSPSTTIINTLVVSDLDNDSLYAENMGCSNQSILMSANISVTRTTAYDMTSSANTFKVDIAPEANMYGTFVIFFDITDGNSTTSVNINVEIVPPPTFTISNTTNPFCFGDNGTVDFSGLDPADEQYDIYSIDGATNLIGSETATSGNFSMFASDGIYPNVFVVASISDMEGTTSQCSSDTLPGGFTISEPPVLVFTAPLSDVTTCNGDQIYLDGAGSASGGTGPYTYNWNNGIINNVGFFPASSLNYQYTVTDANGCTLVNANGVNVTVNNSATNTDSQNACDSLVWIDGITYYSNNNTATFTYANASSQGCDSIVTLDLTIHNSPNVSLSAGTTICENSGEFNLNTIALPTGGDFTGDFVGDGVFNPLNSGVGAHSINYFYTDAFGCSGDATTTITVLDVPEVSLNITDASCANSNGTVDATLTGGSTPYIIYWSNGQTTEDISGLSPNNYYLNVTDANNCYVMDNATVTSSEVVLSGSVTNIICNGLTNGAIDLTVSGSTGPYVYYWSNGKTTQDISNLVAGQYEVFVTDVNNCLSSMSFNVTQPNSITSTISAANPTACGLSDGNLTANVIGGTGAYTFEWLNSTGTPVGGNVSTITGMPADIYTLNVTDINNCTYSSSGTLSESGGPIITLGGKTSSTCSNDGSIDIDITATAAIQSYNWSNLATTQDISNLPSGNYSVLVTDINGCESNFTTTVNPVLPPTTELCIITVDTSTSTNLVVWEKPVSTEIAYFIVYRETSVAGQFLPVDTVLYSEESAFTDPVAYPQLRSWRYKLVTVNNCAVKSLKSTAHKTIHVTISQNAGDYIVSWDSYEGLAYSTFDIYRFTEVGGWDLTPLASLASNVFSYTDATAGVGEVDYLISVTPPSICTSTKAQDHNASRSNTTSSIGTPPGGGTPPVDSSTLIESSEASSTRVYPNPSQHYFTVDFGEQKTATLQVVDVNGKVIFTTSVTNTNQTEINVELANGVYFIEIDDNSTIEHIKIIKN